MVEPQVELQSLAAQWEVDAFGGGELVSVLKNARPRVDPHCGIEQQVLNSRMQILVHDQTGLRCEQDHLRLAADPLLNRLHPSAPLLAAKWEQRDIRVCARDKIIKFNVLIGNKLLHNGCFPGVQRCRRVDIPSQELFGRCLWRQGKQFADLPVNPVTSEQLE